MPYSVFVGVALTIHILTNIDMFTKKDHIAAIHSYRMFLISIAFFYLTDILWGVFESLKWSVPLYIDTFIYFVSMGATIMFWTLFVIHYLKGNKIFSNILKWVGVSFLAAEITLLIVNFFLPVLFSVDENAAYTAYEARHIMLWLQIAMYAIIAIYAMIIIIRKRQLQRRHLAIVLFSAVMIVCIAIQLSDPYIPFYSIGCLIGVAILDSFSVSDTKEKIKAELEKESSIKEEKEHELDEAITIAYKDALTHVNSRYAFVKEEVSIDERIEKQEIDNFAVIVFDINGLKSVNDRFGHQKGDELIIDSATLICHFFPEESIYRYGGDEFVAVLKGEIVKEAQIRHDGFMKMIEHNIKNNKPSISSGISFFDKESDHAFKSTFYRADRMMYERKQFLKSLH